MHNVKWPHFSIALLLTIIAWEKEKKKKKKERKRNKILKFSGLISNCTIFSNVYNVILNFTEWNYYIIFVVIKW